MFPARRPGLTIHSPSATVGIQRTQGARDTATRITLPSHPAIGAQKPQPPHTMTQVTAARLRPAARIHHHFDQMRAIEILFYFFPVNFSLPEAHFQPRHTSSGGNRGSHCCDQHCAVYNDNR